MEKPEHKLDDLFRQRLHGAEVPPPPPVWPALEAELRKKRRKPIWLFLLLGGIGVVAGMSLWYLWPADTQGTLSSALPEQVVIQSASSQEEQPVVAEVSTPPVPVAAKNVEQIAAPREQTGRLPSTEKLRYQSPATTTAKGVEEKPQAPALPEPSAEAETEVSSEKNQDQALSGEQQATESGVGSLLLNEQRLATLFPQPLSYSLKKPLVAPKKIKIAKSKSASRQKLCYDFTRQPSAWLLDVYAGPSVAQRSLTSALDDQPYLNQRLSTEHRNFAMQAGARVSFMFKGNFLVRSGVHYEQITETFEYIDPTSVTYVLTYYPGNPVPDTVGVLYGENYLKTYNRYFFVDIPLTVGMELRSGRSGFSINAGVMANLLFDQRGVIIDPQSHQPARFGPVGKVAPKNGLSEEVFRPGAGFSATASLQWYWHLRPHYRLFVEPSFRQILRPVSLSTHPVEHRYSIFSLRLGATKIF